MDMSEHDIPVKDPQDYIEWLKKRVVAIRKDVDRNTEQTHQQNKTAYDRRHGQKVWLLRGNPKGNSDQILAHRNLVSHHIILQKLYRDIQRSFQVMKIHTQI
jgi:hypothetical protein